MLIAAMAAGTVAQGAYYLPGRVLVTALAAGAFVLALRARAWSWTDAWPVPVACAALSAWTLVRAAMAFAYPAAIAAVATLFTVAAAVVAMRRTGAAAREWCAGALIGLGGLVAFTAWLGVAWRIPRFVQLVEGKLWRGGSTLTYPNAVAALLVPLAVLAIALLVARPAVPVRAAAAYLLLVGTGAALSRAGLIALAVGLAALAVLMGVRTVAWHAAPPVVGAGVAVAALAPSFPAHGTPPQPWLAAAGFLVGLAVAVGAGFVPTWLRAGGLVATLAAGVVAVALVPSAAVRAILASRGNLDSGGRSGAAGAAFDLITEHPLAGTAVGEARFFWTSSYGNGQVALYAHDEYLQVLVDLGAIGFALLLCLLAALAVTVRRGRAFAHRPGVRAGAIAALMAFAVHSGFDFLWHIAVLPLAGALLVGLAGPAISGEPSGPTTAEGKE